MKTMHMLENGYYWKAKLRAFECTKEEQFEDRK